MRSQYLPHYHAEVDPFTRMDQKRPGDGSQVFLIKYAQVFEALCCKEDNDDDNQKVDPPGGARKARTKGSTESRTITIQTQSR